MLFGFFPKGGAIIFMILLRLDGNFFDPILRGGNFCSFGIT